VAPGPREADRIREKHLLTLEPGISTTQTDEMRKERLRLVLPHTLHESYRPAQRAELSTVAEFIELARQLTCAEPGAATRVSPGMLF
jgi:hypothetical protein